MNRKWVQISLLLVGIVIIAIVLIGFNIAKNQGVIGGQDARMLPIQALLQDENADTNAIGII